MGLFSPVKEKGSRKRSLLGFTLVEIMTVVTIAGILTLLGMANFQRFQTKARQKEAKSLLGDMFGRMTAFQTEWGDYYGEWVDIGFAPSGALGYNVGFAAAGPDPTNADWFRVTMGMVYIDADACGMSVDTCVDNGLPAISIGACTWMAASFLACAEGDLQMGMNDIWTVDQVKFLTNQQDGTF